jgi:acetyl esterase/lipase
MKKLTLPLLMCFVIFKTLNAQQPAANDSTPAKCKWNLMNPVYTDYDSVLNVSYAKSPFPQQCKDVSYDGDETVENCDPVDSEASGAPSLFYDVYFPKHDYSSLKLPAIIIGHPGGFMECSNLHNSFMTTLCTTFARRGFVVFNIEYRRGRVLDPAENFFYNSVQQEEAVYRGCQDMRGAIRSIIKRERLKSEPYSIDTNKIFIGGASAGGVMAINTAWYTNSMVYKSFPTPKGHLTVKDVLGPIDASYYFGEPSINFKQRIKGVMVLWGGMFIPNSFKNNQSLFFTNATLKPLIAFHGKDDKVFPFYMDSVQDIYFSPPPKTDTEFNYNRDTRCLIDTPYLLENKANTKDLINASPLNMYSILDSLAPATPKELYIDCDMRHGLDDDGLNFDSEFGTGDTTRTQATFYIAQRVAIFFQAVMNGFTATDLNVSKFTECKNTRKKCEPSKLRCSNNDICDHPQAGSQYVLNKNCSTAEKELLVKLYPNPVKNILNVVGLTANNTHLFITDLNGNALKQVVTSAAFYTFDTRTLSPGIYFLKIESSKQNKSLKFVKE